VSSSGHIHLGGLMFLNPQMVLLHNTTSIFEDFTTETAKKIEMNSSSLVTVLGLISLML
jgi:hypothetical protein